MSWADDIIAGPMGYKYAVLFPRARDAIFHYRWPLELPSNICPEAHARIHEPTLIPVHPSDGMARGVAVQLYGYRERVEGAFLDLDPLMTGWYSRPCTTSSIISFGRNKILPLNGGGAFLTQDEALAEIMREHEYFPGGYENAKAVRSQLQQLNFIVQQRFERIALWDRHLGDTLVRIPREQIMPWRVMRRAPFRRDAVVRELRHAGIAVGTNYPPLPGVTDPGAILWGAQVINFLIDQEIEDYDLYVFRACELIKRTLDTQWLKS